MRAQHMRRFWTKVSASGDCWEWGAAKDRNGYGLWTPPRSSGRRMGVAHRFAYAEMVGEVPDGLELDHLCRNTSCVNPDHLEAVSHAENIRRAHAHRIRRTQESRPKPQVRGASIPGAVVAVGRRMLANGWTVTEVEGFARIFGTTPSALMAEAERDEVAS